MGSTMSPSVGLGRGLPTYISLVFKLLQKELLVVLSSILVFTFSISTQVILFTLFCVLALSALNVNV